MPRRLITTLIAVALLLLLTVAPSNAAPLQGPQIVSAHADPAGWIEMFAICPAPDSSDWSIAIDGGPPAPPQSITPTYAPPVLALLVERSPGMTSQHSDPANPSVALGQAEQLLSSLPAASLVAAVAYGEQVDLLAPLSGDLAATQAALATALSQPVSVQPASGTLAKAIALSRAQLSTAPPGPQALVILAADGPATGEPLPPPDNDAPTITIIGLNPASESGLRASADALGGLFLPSYSQTPEDQPAQQAQLQARYASITAPPHLVRMLITPPALVPGRHHLALRGCGGADDHWINTTAPPFGWQIPAFSALGGLLFGLLAGRTITQWGRRPATRGADTYDARWQPGGAGSAGGGVDGPTERGARRQARPDLPRYRLVVWAGQRRISHELHERQCVIGRSPGCDLQITAPQVADLHARITTAGDQISLMDLDSGSGTSLGAGGPQLKAHQPTILQEGDEFWLGTEVRVALRRSEQGA